MMKGPKPKRTVVFAAMIGEEVGLLGTNWYIAHPAIPLANMAANLEIEDDRRPDSLAGGVGRAWLTGYERSTMATNSPRTDSHRAGQTPRPAILPAQ